MGESGGKEDLASIKSRYGGRAFPLAGYYYERLPLSPARAAFASARRRARGSSWPALPAADPARHLDGGAISPRP